MIDDYIRQRENLANLFVLVDSRHEPQQKDIDFINRLGEWQIPFTIVFTKSDKNKPGATVRNVNAFMTALSRTWTEPPVYFISSALVGNGKKEILDYIESLNSKSLNGVNKNRIFTYMIAGFICYIAAGFSRRIMRKILSEKNIAALLFVLVILAFSFAHEDSKKRSLNYNVSSQYGSPEKRTPSLSVNTPTVNNIVVKGN
jgi:hypothetical protein